MISSHSLGVVFCLAVLCGSVLSSAEWTEEGSNSECSDLCQQVKDLKKIVDELHSAHFGKEKEDPNILHAQLRVSFKRFTEGPAKCANKRGQVKSRFLLAGSKSAATAQQCGHHCHGSEVFQFNAATKFCSCTSIKGTYLLVFPRRYIQCTNSESEHEIFYNDASIRADFLAIGTPQLYYPLDDVSGTSNIGSLDSDGYNAQWDRGRGTFDCPWGGDAVPNRAYLLRLTPEDQPLLRIHHDLKPTTYTWITWFKKRDPNSQVMPLIEGSVANDARWLWHIWNYPNNNQIIWNLGNKYTEPPVQFYRTGWNFATVRVKPGEYWGDVNGREVTSAQFPLNDPNAVFGETITIGGRNVNGDGLSGRVWDGCLGHYMFFNRTLSLDEERLMASVIADEDF